MTLWSVLYLAFVTLIFLVSMSINEFGEAAPLEEWCEKQWINNSASHVALPLKNVVHS